MSPTIEITPGLPKDPRIDALAREHRERPFTRNASSPRPRRGDGKACIDDIKSKYR